MHLAVFFLREMKENLFIAERQSQVRVQDLKKGGGGVSTQDFSKSFCENTPPGSAPKSHY